MQAPSKPSSCEPASQQRVCTWCCSHLLRGPHWHRPGAAAPACNPPKQTGPGGAGLRDCVHRRQCHRHRGGGRACEAGGGADRLPRDAGRWVLLGWCPVRPFFQPLRLACGCWTVGAACVCSCVVGCWDASRLLPLLLLLACAHLLSWTSGGAAAPQPAAGAHPAADHCYPPPLRAGRVKTLHPGVHGGILARRDLPQHMDAIGQARGRAALLRRLRSSAAMQHRALSWLCTPRGLPPCSPRCPAADSLRCPPPNSPLPVVQHNIQPIDIVVVNLYPFRQTVTAANKPSYEASRRCTLPDPTHPPAASSGGAGAAARARLARRALPCTACSTAQEAPRLLPGCPAENVPCKPLLPSCPPAGGCREHRHWRPRHDPRRSQEPRARHRGALRTGAGLLPLGLAARLRAWRYVPCSFWDCSPSSSQSLDLVG